MRMSLSKTAAMLEKPDMAGAINAFGRPKEAW